MQCLNIFRTPSFLKLSTKPGTERQVLKILGDTYYSDDFTNVTPKIISYIGRNLLNNKFNPLCFTKEKIINYFYQTFKNTRGNPSFSMYDDLNPVVTVYENFDSLLIPENHVSRNKSECYYINRNQLLRAHTTAHQSELIKMGLDKFVIFGDVYRRDDIDSTHYPVFHQSDAVSLFNKTELEKMVGNKVLLFEKHKSEDTPDRQSFHTLDAAKIVEVQLKSTLINLIKNLYGKDTPCRWVDEYFPFTHPSWELEIFSNDKWVEVLGCGIVRHRILQQAGAEDKIGWAFGMGLERVAMHLYGIPDIRLFWSNDSGFLNQFKDKTVDDQITYQPISVYPQCINDISFWVPENFEVKDFFDLVREIGGDLVEQIHLVDDFTHPKTSKRSLCYRIVYRHLERTLTQNEVSLIHKSIEEKATDHLGVTIR